MIRRRTEHCTLEISCDGSDCRAELTVAGKDQYEAVSRARQEGWRFRYPRSWCPTCPVPAATDQATIGKG
jgi:hypothetical protein